MIVYVYDFDFNLLQALDSYQSFIWNRKYNDIGTFELHVPLTEENLKYLKIGNVVSKHFGYIENNETPEGGLIEKIEITLSSSGEEMLKVTGSFLTNILSWRIIEWTYYYKGKTEEMLYNLIEKNLTECQDDDRQILYTTTAGVQGYTETIEYQNTWGNLSDEVLSVCKSADYGIRTIFNPTGKTYSFQVYKGLDRSVNQTNNPICIFSREYENVISQEYSQSESDFKNMAYIGGEGEGSSRTVVRINDSSKVDRYRRELFIDARDMQREVNGTTLTNAEYQSNLEQRGFEKLAEHQKLTTFESTVNTRGTYIYKKDYDLGDKVTIRDKKLNLTLDTRITEIQEVYESGKVDINLTFGNSIPTIYDKLRKVK